MIDVSKAHPKFDEPRQWELPFCLEMRGYAPTDLNLEAVTVGMHAYSHVALGGDALTCLLPTEQASRYSAYLQSFPIETLSGETPLDKGISFAALIKAEGNTSNQSNTKMVKGALEELRMKVPSSGEKTEVYPEDELATLDRETKEFLAAMGKIRSIKTIRPGKAVSREIDPEGQQDIWEYMSDLSQIVRLPVEDLADPLLMKKLAELDFVIDTPMRLVERKKLLFLIIDRSSSMGMPPMKLAYIKALITYLAEGIGKGNCILMVATFEEDLDSPITVLDTEEEAVQFAQAYHTIGGSTTNVQRAIEDAIKEMHKPRAKVPAGLVPEIVIINDGEDEVIPVAMPHPVHVIILGSENRELQKLCSLSKGTFNHIRL
jgi:hypothetical protein